MITSLLLATSALSPILLQQEEVKPLDEAVLARIGDQEIKKSDYLEFLYLRFGKRAAEEYLGELLVAEEAHEYGIVVSAEEIEGIAEQREHAARANPRPDTFEDELKRNGQNLKIYRAASRAEIHHELLLDRLVRKTRIVTDERLAQAFEIKYGTGGRKLRVQHVVIMPNMIRAEKLQGGLKASAVNMDEMQSLAEQRAKQLRDQIIAGADFQSIAAQHSHDRVTKDRGGELLNYNGRLYGPAFYDAVANLPLGETSAVIKTGAGYHIAQVLERSVTKLANVRDSLTKEILASDPSWQEKNALVQALRAKADIQLW